MSQLQSISEWYSGRQILVTGGTGFMGKILLEKFLRSVPTLDKIFIFMRPKRGLSPEERIENMKTLPLFKNLNETNPEVFKKLIPIKADICLPNLGIDDNVVKLLKNVSVVFHNAACLRMEAELRDAFVANTLGTKLVMELCTKLPKIEAVIHLSTAFCQPTVNELDEITYKPPHDPEEIAHLLNILDDKAISTITPSLLGQHPNCYTYTKCLAEAIVDSFGTKLPVVILRPSIVIPTLAEPMPGWVDSLNGPVGIMVAGGKGVIRTMLVEPNFHAEVIPVDVAINGMITIAWYRATHSFKNVPVFNMTTSDIVKITWSEILDKGKAISRKYPFDWPIVWYPDGDLRTNRVTHNILHFFCHFLPAYFIDFLMLLFMQPRFMVRIYNRVTVGLHLLQYFTMRQWIFKNKNFVGMSDVLSEKDSNTFYMANSKFEVDQYLLNSLLGTRQYCLKEDLSTIPRARKIHMCYFVVDRLLKMILIIGIFYYTLYMFNATYLIHVSEWKNNVFKPVLKTILTNQ